MNSLTYKILKYIYKNPENQSINNLRNKFNNTDFLIVMDSYKYLIDNKFIANRNGSIKLLPNGIDYCKSVKKKFFKWLFTSVAIPIFVGVTATIITNLLTTSNDNSCNYTCDCTQNTSLNNQK